MTAAPGSVLNSDMPNQPKTPGRSVRVADELWQAAHQRAAAEGTTVTEVIVEALRRYVEGPDDQDD